MHGELWKIIAAQTNDGHAECLEIFERARQIEKRFCTTTNRHDVVRGDRAEIAADIASCFGATVHAANAAS